MSTVNPSTDATPVSRPARVLTLVEAPQGAPEEEDWDDSNAPPATNGVREGYLKTAGAPARLPGGATAGLNLIRASKVTPRKVQWLWDGYVPRGKITLLEGDPGTGKTTIALDIAARVTCGGALPTGSCAGEPADVLIISVEDDAGDTLRPRLEAAGADLERVHFLVQSDPVASIPSIPDAVPAIEEAIAALGARLLVLDPLMALLSEDINGHKDQDVRRALGPLHAMAVRTGVAVVLIRHLNKAAGMSAMYRGGGSVGISGAARSILLVAKDPHDPEGRVLACTKPSVGRAPPSLAYGVVGKGDASAIAWGGVSPLTADQLVLDEARGPAPEKLNDAKEFLRGILASGPVRKDKIEGDAQAGGIGATTLRRAKDALKVVARKTGFNGPWEWSLPSAVDAA